MLAESKNFWLNLDKIQTVLLKSDKEFADYLGLNYAVYVKSKRKNSFLPLNCILEFAERLNFHFEDLLLEDFDTYSIQNFSQGSFSLSEKYSNAAYSKTKQIGNILNFVQQSKGEREKINLLRKFQLTEDFVLNGDSNTNILLFTDIVNYLSKIYQFSDLDFLKIGRMTPLTLANTELEHNLIAQKSIYELVDFFVNDCAGMFDRNYTYRISNISKDFAIIDAKPNKIVLDELKLIPSQMGNEHACLTRMGVISSITWFKYKRFIKIDKISSIYNGDATNRYLLDISSIKESSCQANADILSFNSIKH